MPVSSAVLRNASLPFNRRPIEKELVYNLSKYNAKFARQLRKSDDPVSDTALWRGYGIGLIATMEPHLLAAHEKQYDAYNKLYGLPFDKQTYLTGYNDFANAKLSTYATLAAYNAQAAVRQIYQRAQAEGWGEDLILEHLFRRFGPSAAEAIGVTELTRLLTFGSGLIVDLLRENNIYADQVWFTVPDERRCPICAALHGKTRDVWVQYGQDDGPPAHPHCRCWVLVLGLRLLRPNR